MVCPGTSRTSEGTSDIGTGAWMLQEINRPIEHEVASTGHFSAFSEPLSRGQTGGPSSYPTI